MFKAFLNSRQSLVITALASTLLLAACASDTARQADKKTPENRIQDLQVVDCLLPGQTRMLGNQVYVTPRRPVMVTAAECRIRGGEYVAYDRADYRTALNVWLPSAEAGDAEAQANVGEIFERGLGGSPNYEVAAHWYRKAAGQGNKRAQFNLGTLYEQGLGVAQDRLTAMNYYRQAWGLPEDSLVYQSAVQEQQQEMEEQLQREIARKDNQIRMLQNQVAALNSELSQQQNNQELLAQLEDLQALVDDLESENSTSRQQLARLERSDTQRLRTVVSPDQPTFSGSAREVIGKDINFGKYYALVIGVQDYENVESLYTPLNDVQAVAEVLEEDYGFTVTTVVNADNISIMEAINNLNQQLTENDNLLIFYAGHGVRLHDEQLESGYWLPRNADAPPRDTNWVSNEFITRHLARLKAKRVLVVADSCYAGLLSSSPDFLFAGSQQNSPEFLRYKAERRSRLLLTSGGDKPVLDGSGEDRHSIFASAFIDTLKNNTDIMTGPELFKAVHERVVRESAEVDFEQEPQYRAIKGAGHEVGDFFFVPQRAKL